MNLGQILKSEGEVSELHFDLIFAISSYVYAWAKNTFPTPFI